MVCDRYWTFWSVFRETILEGILPRKIWNRIWIWKNKRGGVPRLVLLLHMVAKVVRAFHSFQVNVEKLPNSEHISLKDWIFHISHIYVHIHVYHHHNHNRRRHYLNQNQTSSLNLNLTCYYYYHCHYFRRHHSWSMTLIKIQCIINVQLLVLSIESNLSTLSHFHFLFAHVHLHLHGRIYIPALAS